MYTCRPAQSEDYQTICTFVETEDELYFMFPSGKFPLQAGQLEQNAKNRWCPTIVEDESGIAGYANFYGYEEGKQCHLGNVIVAPAHRGQGAAAFLIRTMITKASAELNVPRLLLVCHSTNPRALLFYDKLGFKPFALSKKLNFRGEAIVGISMEKLLEQP
ncbi:GNAT family N-acetyltransferase [Paenibacillus ginsengarvi]|nr:GNAT family N-acetyltransferase [Paenibacillus ginsengarvi]